MQFNPCPRCKSTKGFCNVGAQVYDSCIDCGLSHWIMDKMFIKYSFLTRHDSLAWYLDDQITKYFPPDYRADNQNAYVFPLLPLDISAERLKQLLVFS